MRRKVYEGLRNSAGCQSDQCRHEPPPFASIGMSFGNWGGLLDGMAFQLFLMPFLSKGMLLTKAADSGLDTAAADKGDAELGGGMRMGRRRRPSATSASATAAASTKPISLGSPSARTSSKSRRMASLSSSHNGGPKDTLEAQAKRATAKKPPPTNHIQLPGKPPKLPSPNGDGGGLRRPFQSILPPALVRAAEGARQALATKMDAWGASVVQGHGLELDSSRYLTLADVRAYAEMDPVGLGVYYFVNTYFCWICAQALFTIVPRYIEAERKLRELQEEIQRLENHIRHYKILRHASEAEAARLATPLGQNDLHVVFMDWPGWDLAAYSKSVRYEGLLGAVRKRQDQATTVGKAVFGALVEAMSHAMSALGSAEQTVSRAVSGGSALELDSRYRGAMSQGLGMGESRGKPIEGIIINGRLRRGRMWQWQSGLATSHRFYPSSRRLVLRQPYYSNRERQATVAFGDGAGDMPHLGSSWFGVRIVAFLFISRLWRIWVHGLPVPCGGLAHCRGDHVGVSTFGFDGRVMEGALAWQWLLF
eukprot:jgi/Mesvir1/15359/Mv26327-RA.1